MKISIRPFNAAIMAGIVMAGTLLPPIAVRAQTPTTAGAQITGSLANFDVRYPRSLPNDIEIVIYGVNIKASDVAGTWNTNILLGGRGLQWGTASSITASVNNDPVSPAFGLDCVTIRYAGPPRPAMVGQMVHIGVRLKLGVVVSHQEVWWTINGQRIIRPCDPHVTWFCTRQGILICVANPTPQPIYVYAPRYFAVPTTVRLPLLSQLSLDIQPQQFGATGWTSLPLPGTGTRLQCIQPWCRIYFRIIVNRWRPVTFQIAARNVPEAVFPLQNPTAPDPNDFRPDPTGQGDGQGTMAILTGRATEQVPEDLNMDGFTGVPDFNQFRTEFLRNVPSEDNITVNDGGIPP